MRSGWTPTQLLTVITLEGRHQTVGVGRDSEGDFCLSPDSLPNKNLKKVRKKREKTNKKTPQKLKNKQKVIKRLTCTSCKA